MCWKDHITNNKLDQLSGTCDTFAAAKTSSILSETDLPYLDLVLFTVVRLGLCVLGMFDHVLYSTTNISDTAQVWWKLQMSNNEAQHHLLDEDSCPLTKMIATHCPRWP